MNAPRYCVHHACRCARAAELAAAGCTLEAAQVHTLGEPVRCREPHGAPGLRCRLGLHRWNYLGTLRACARCPAVEFERHATAGPALGARYWRAK